LRFPFLGKFLPQGFLVHITQFPVVPVTIFPDSFYFPPPPAPGSHLIPPSTHALFSCIISFLSPDIQRVFPSDHANFLLRGEEGGGGQGREWPKQCMHMWINE
jgi:hypothetical protein